MGVLHEATQAPHLLRVDPQQERTPVDEPAGRYDNTVASEAEVVCTLSVEETRTLLQEVPAVYHTQINDVLLTALVQSFGQWTDP